MRFKLSLLVLLTVFSLFSFASADLSSPGVIVNATHGQDVTINFALINSDSTYSVLNWTAGTTDGKGSWKQIPLNGSSIGVENKSFSAIFSVSQYTLSTILNTQLTVTNSSGSSSGVVPVSIPIQINILSTPSLSMTKTKDLTKTQNATINITNNGNVVFSRITLMASGLATVAFSENDFALSLSPGASKTITVSVSDFSSLKFGDNPITITTTTTPGSTSASTILSLKQSFCKSGEVGTSNLSITGVDINNEGNGDDNTWNFLDKFIIDVDVENIGNNDIDDVQVQIGLFDSQGRNMVNDLDFTSKDDEKIDLGDFNDGDRETATFEFQVPADISSGNYKLAVKAFSKKSGESNVCVDSSDDLSNKIFEDIQVEKENDQGKFIAFDNIKFNPSEATCSESVSLTLDVFNVGDEDQDQVRINLVSKDLQLDQSFEIKSNLDQGDKEKISFNFNVPSGLSDKTYILLLSSEYDYRNGNYREFSDEDYPLGLKVIGCTPQTNGTSSRNAGITASLTSDAKAGSPMIVESTITNLGSQTTTFAIDVSGYNNWAKLSSISNRLVTLQAGESKKVTFTFDINSDASGEQSFIIEVQSGQKVDRKEVAVNIAGSGGSQFSSLFKNNGLIWVIGIINLILVILIIVVAVRVSRK